MSILTKPRGSGPTSDASNALVPAGAAAAATAFQAVAPRAYLMPPELAQGQKERSLRRGLRIVVVVIAAITALAVGGAVYLALGAQSSLAEAHQQTVAQQARLAKLRDIKNTTTWIANAEAATRVGGSTDIEWADFFDDLRAHLPEGVTLTSVDVKSADAVTPYEQSTIPLEKPRIGEVSFTASSPTLPVLPEWISGLSGVRGFADASPTGVTSENDPSGSAYTASVVMHINTDAYSHRFAQEKKK